MKVNQERNSPDSAWPLVDEAGEPFHRRERPERVPHHIKFLDDYCPCEDAARALWYIPLLVIILTFFWIITPQ
jgi:hypothetical protein